MWNILARDYPGFVKKIDRWLLLKHPILWRTQIHLVVFWCLILSIILFVGGWVFPNDGHTLRVNPILPVFLHEESSYFIMSSVPFLFYWAYHQYKKGVPHFTLWQTAQTLLCYFIGVFLIYGITTSSFYLGMLLKTSSHMTADEIRDLKESGQLYYGYMIHDMSIDSSGNISDDNISTARARFLDIVSMENQILQNRYNFDGLLNEKLPDIREFGLNREMRRPFHFPEAIYKNQYNFLKDRHALAFFALYRMANEKDPRYDDPNALKNYRYLRLRLKHYNLLKDKIDNQGYYQNGIRDFFENYFDINFHPEDTTAYKTYIRDRVYMRTVMEAESFFKNIQHSENDFEFPTPINFTQSGMLTEGVIRTFQINLVDFNRAESYDNELTILDNALNRTVSRLARISNGQLLEKHVEEKVFSLTSSLPTDITKKYIDKFNIGLEEEVLYMDKNSVALEQLYTSRLEELVWSIENAKLFFKEKILLRHFKLIIPTTFSIIIVFFLIPFLTAKWVLISLMINGVVASFYWFNPFLIYGFSLEQVFLALGLLYLGFLLLEILVKKKTWMYDFAKASFAVNTAFLSTLILWLSHVKFGFHQDGYNILEFLVLALVASFLVGLCQALPRKVA